MEKMSNIQILILVLAIAFGVYYFTGDDSSVDEKLDASVIDVVNNIDTTDLESYIDEKYEFRYSESLSLDHFAYKTPIKSTRVAFFGERQVNSGKTDLSVFEDLGFFDGYLFIVADLGQESNLDAKGYATKEMVSHEKECGKSKVSELSDISLSSQEGYSFSVENCLGSYTLSYVSFGDSLYKTTQFYVGNDEDKKEYKKATEDILNTFEFLEL